VNSLSISELISHEAKNILGIIYSRCELLKLRSPNSVSETEFVTFAHGMLDRLGLLVQFSETLSGPIRFEPVHCASVIDSVISSVRLGYPEYRMSLIASDADQECMIVSSPLLLYHTLFNLVLNAIQSMFGSGDIDITLTAGKQVTIEVKDTGSGIAEDIMARLFDGGKSSRLGGSGLGLSLVKKLVEMQFGQIEVVTFLSKGTTFKMRFPTVTGSDSLTPSHDIAEDPTLPDILAIFKRPIGQLREMIDAKNFDDLEAVVFDCTRQLSVRLRRGGSPQSQH